MNNLVQRPIGSACSAHRPRYRALNRGTIIAAGLAMTLSAALAAAEVIDRVLAVVGGQIITLSDAHAVLRLGLMAPGAAEDPVGAVLSRLIDRRLMLAEIERYAPPDPPEAAINAGVAAVRDRFTDGAAYEAALERTVMSHDDVRRYVADTMRIDAYVEQRVGAVGPPAEDDLARYYREHAGTFTKDGVLLPYGAVREEIRARLLDASRAALVQAWVDGLRRRGSVVVLYLPGQR